MGSDRGVSAIEQEKVLSRGEKELEMIQMQTVLEAADNSGAKNLMCIKVLGGSKKRYARVGDIIVASIKDCIPNKSELGTSSRCYFA